MTEEDFITGLGGRKIPIEHLRLDIYDRELFHELLICFEKAMDWPEVRSFHNNTLNLFMTSLVSMMIDFESTGKMELYMSHGNLTIRAGVVDIENIETSTGRSFLCTDERVRIDAYDKHIIKKMLDCMENIVAKQEEKKYFIPRFHHRTLNAFFTKLYKLLFETDKLRHFNSCVDKEGRLYVSTPFAGK